jgi:hypothetical protein
LPLILLCSTNIIDSDTCTENPAVTWLQVVLAMVDDPSTGDRVFPGHLGHLSPAQEESLVTFKANLAEASLYTYPSNAGQASHDEPTLLYVQIIIVTSAAILTYILASRFLRARGFDVVAAQKQFSDAENWRKRHGVDKLYNTFDAEEFESSKRFYPRWTGRRDKVCDAILHSNPVHSHPQNGLPLYVYRVVSLDPMRKELDSVPPQRRYQRMYVSLLSFTWT